MSAGSPGSNEPRHVRGFAFQVSQIVPDLVPVSESRSFIIAIGAGLGILYVAAIVLSFPRAVHGDELYHFAQIQLFLRGEFRFLDHYLTTIPGYHAAVAALLRLSGQDSLGAARAVNAAFGIVAAAGFLRLRRRWWPGSETLATAQMIALPILAPLFFLVYTDVLALALVLWALVAMFAGRHRWSAAALLAVVLVRQNDVVWAAFVALMAVWPELRVHGRATRVRHVVHAWPYSIPIFVFLGFWACNGTISLSHEQAQLHPLTLHLGNIFFGLLLLGILLPLQVFAGLGEFFNQVRQRPWLAFLPVIVMAAYWWGFQADNPYNSALPQFLPRNGLLARIDHDPLWRAGAGAIMMLAACGLATTRLRPRDAWWLYPVSALFLAASWLIEQRYLLVPLVLWLAFREQRSRAMEYATLALWLAFAVCIVWAVVSGRFFL